MIIIVYRNIKKIVIIIKKFEYLNILYIVCIFIKWIKFI